MKDMQLLFKTLKEMLKRELMTESEPHIDITYKLSKTPSLENVKM